MEILMSKSPHDQLLPFDSDAHDALKKIKIGETVKVTIKRCRNPRFHRKVFALFKLAFDYWEAPDLEYKGTTVSKNFDQFRKDITILAGFYEATVNLRGEVRLTAQSLSFASMSEERFQNVYKAILSTVWSRLMKDKGFATEDELNEVIEKFLQFE